MQKQLSVERRKGHTRIDMSTQEHQPYQQSVDLQPVMAEIDSCLNEWENDAQAALSIYDHESFFSVRNKVSSSQENKHVYFFVLCQRY